MYRSDPSSDTFEILQLLSAEIILFNVHKLIEVHIHVVESTLAKLIAVNCILDDKTQTCSQNNTPILIWACVCCDVFMPFVLVYVMRLRRPSAIVRLVYRYNSY